MIFCSIAYTIGDTYTTQMHPSLDMRTLLANFSPTLARSTSSYYAKGTCLLLCGLCGMSGLTLSSVSSGWSSRVTFALAADGFLLCFGMAVAGLYLLEKSKANNIAQSVIRV
jgi:hypothetical protein